MATEIPQSQDTQPVAGNQRWNSLFRRIAFTLLAFCVAGYVTSYIVLSRRGFAYSDQRRAEGFYFFTPQNTDDWRFQNYALVRFYYPLIAIDNALGTGRPAAAEPLFDLE